MAEAVRLVIWDLDETFWRGTLTEGGFQFVYENAAIVIELAKRGIVSSICTKNDPAPVKKVMDHFGLHDYFVFASVNWEAKGRRVAGIIEAMQLRPASVLFIDDNPGNLGEARALLPDLQVAHPEFLPELLSDPRFVGKPDFGLTRLKQYKLLETRHVEAAKSEGSNVDFLRQSDIRVCLEYDIEAHIDRAIELINRTNQLNFTKQRLPEDSEAARAILRAQIAPFHRQAALVKVVDKYGDYGFVGFFVKDNFGAVNGRLLHYCFSCRTLGMSVENWLYDFLGRPQVETIGEVVTDLGAATPVDWVRFGRGEEVKERGEAARTPLIVLWGGCEVQSISLYLASAAQALRLVGNLSVGGLMFRMNSSVLLNEILQRNSAEFSAEAEIFGIPAAFLAMDFVGAAPEASLFVLNISADAGERPLYRHKRHGWIVLVEIAYGLDEVEIDRLSEDELGQRLDSIPNLPSEQRAHFLAVRRHLVANYENIRPAVDAEGHEASVRRLLESLPIGSRCVLTVDYCKNRWVDSVRENPRQVAHAAELARIAADYPHVAFVPHAVAIKNDDEVQHGGGSHYDRIVYQRFAEKVLAAAAGLPGRGRKLPSTAVAPPPIETVVEKRARVSVPPFSASLPLSLRAVAISNFDDSRVEKAFVLLEGAGWSKPAVERHLATGGRIWALEAAGPRNGHEPLALGLVRDGELVRLMVDRRAAGSEIGKAALWWFERDAARGGFATIAACDPDPESRQWFAENGYTLSGSHFIKDATKITPWPAQIGFQWGAG